ncbi:MAG: hypothetical protein JWM36_1455 [Hyphomicrobiales bacterium]|nr:hypothetical protein [Hyphomicrobiales bacterium]
MIRLRRIALFVLAVLFLVEAWIWDCFSALGHRLARLLHLARLIDALRSSIGRLSPYATLPLFILPAVAIFPFKILALWLIGHGHVVYGGLTFLGAKTVGVGVTAVLFDLCREQLLSIGWFARLYAKVLVFRTWASELVAPLRLRMAELQTSLRSLLGQGSFGRHVLSLRARIRQRLAR